MQTGHAISPDRLGAPVPGTEKQGVRAAAKIKHTESSCNCFRTNPIPAAPRTENKGEPKGGGAAAMILPVSGHFNWEQPCFTVNGLSIFAAGSYGSWIYVPIAFCIYRLWPGSGSSSSSGFSCRSLIIECHLIKNTKPMPAQICLHIK